jgi:hypothetical protein
MGIGKNSCSSSSGFIVPLLVSIGIWNLGGGVNGLTLSISQRCECSLGDEKRLEIRRRPRDLVNHSR